MKVTLFDGRTPPPEVAAALGRFEREFVYPLGPDAAFHISHQPEYLRFFLAIGKARLWVAREPDGEVAGTLVAVERTLLEDGREITAHYLCDLKVRKSARHSSALARLFAAAADFIRGTSSQRCYGVVMGGSDRSPGDYTGRVGIPPFPLIGRIELLRMTGDGLLSERCREVAGPVIARDGYASTGGLPFLRSMHPPIPITSRDGSAGGSLENTLRSKRLLLQGGGELLSSHLSRFAFTDAEAGVALLRHALALSAERNIPALFVAVPFSRSEEIRECLTRTGQGFSVAPAEIYGHDFDAGRDWWIDTTEI